MKYQGLHLSFFAILIAAWLLPSRLDAQDGTRVLNDLERMLEKVSTFDMDQTRAWHQDFLDLMAIIYRDPSLQPDAEKLLVKALEEGSSKTGSIWICKELGIIGTDYSVTVLSGFLVDPKNREIALLALEKIPGSKSDAVLRMAFDQGDRDTKIAVMGSLAVRKDLKSVDQLEALAGDPDRSWRVQPLGPWESLVVRKPRGYWKNVSKSPGARPGGSWPMHGLSAQMDSSRRERPERRVRST